jgi:hypothetical protein
VDQEIRTFGEAGDRLLPWVLRIGVAGCFIGHGAFGILTKAEWLPYFAVGGIGAPVAWRVMPWIGSMDIAMGLLALAWPCRALFFWALVWGGWTALLRPLSGEPGWEFAERAGNYGVALALLIAFGLGGTLFSRLPVRWPSLSAVKRIRLIWVLRLTTAALLVGHGGLGLFSHKAGLVHHYSALGLGNPTSWTAAIGAVEFFLAALALLRPRSGLFVGICAWKIATESLFIVSGAPFWELIERFGSYAAPLAVALLLQAQRSPESSSAPLDVAHPMSSSDLSPT